MIGLIDFFVSALSSDSCVALLVSFFDVFCECSTLGLGRQQHINRKLSTRVSHVSSIASLVLPPLLLSLSSSSVGFPLVMDFVAGDARFVFVARAFEIPAADRGVVALPLASVWVIKSGIATGSAVGDFGIPGDRRSLLPRTPLGVAVDGLRCSLLLLTLVSTVKFGL